MHLRILSLSRSVSLQESFIISVSHSLNICSILELRWAREHSVVCDSSPRCTQFVRRYSTISHAGDASLWRWIHTERERTSSESKLFLDQSCSKGQPDNVVHATKCVICDHFSDMTAKTLYMSVAKIIRLSILSMVWFGLCTKMTWLWLRKHCGQNKWKTATDVQMWPTALTHLLSV